ncbi:lysophospholipid acyltransferase LPEAT2 [Dioscorea cayenensis subsp. rotundata]|uniref:Lysophospholipid acyltransferase LPEAT2 n=1 Tax=Dioscorea cayennensis subsp. rotundata TaxID=55577 RepID=A0AB40BLN5_DIOCR|nr:lysophospholipid acyltransferase LPEAT2 [Dioscorea cayenensis subsp. rotundata]
MASDLRARLLPENGEVVIDVEGRAETNGVGEYHTRSFSNPFDFVGAAPLVDLRLPSTIDPFRNHTPGFGGVYEWIKMVVCVPIAILRLVLFGISISIGFLATKLALEGWKDRQNPMPKWRCRLMWVTRFCSRCILFSFGYHWIKRIGKPASRDIAPIVVSNHISYIDPIFFFYELFPTIVASESHDSLPFVGTIIRAMQVIYVDRFSAPSRRQAVNEIKRKASCNGFPRVLLFPEGTTTNGRALISFQLGAFIPGFPVQPVIVRYPHVHFDQSWGNISLAKLMFRMFLQFHNFMEVEYLPIVLPQEKKHETVAQFAQRTSYAMASALNVVQTSHSYVDGMLLTRASELMKENCSNYMVEMAWADNLFQISTSDAMEFLDQFLAMDPDSNGCVQKHDFLICLGLEKSPLGEKIFSYFDVEKKNSITFRQFLLGSANIRKQPLFHEVCNTAFSKCDYEETGFISAEQLTHFLRSSCLGTIEQTFARLLNFFDIDNDGPVTRAKFMEGLWKYPILVAFFTCDPN